MYQPKDISQEVPFQFTSISFFLTFAQYSRHQSTLRIPRTRQSLKDRFSPTRQHLYKVAVKIYIYNRLSVQKTYYAFLEMKPRTAPPPLLIYKGANKKVNVRVNSSFVENFKGYLLLIGTIENDNECFDLMFYINQCFVSAGNISLLLLLYQLVSQFLRTIFLHQRCGCFHCIV